MNYFKKLFEFLIQKDHLVTKKIHTLGAVIVTICLISILLLGVNGYASSMYQDNSIDEQNNIAKEDELLELEELELEEEDFSLQIISPTYKSSTMIDYVEYITSQANIQVEEHVLAISTEDNTKLSTAGLESEDEGIVLISADEVDVTPNRDQIVLTKSDYQVLLTIVEAEVGAEDLYLRMMIANTIINRMQHEYYPDTIEEVVFQNNGKVYQFSPIKDGRYWEVQVSSKTITAVNNALAGYDNSEGALAFVNRSITNPKTMEWFDNNLIFVTKYGKVEFFTF